MPIVHNLKRIPPMAQSVSVEIPTSSSSVAQAGSVSVSVEIPTSSSSVAQQGSVSVMIPTSSSPMAQPVRGSEVVPSTCTRLDLERDGLEVIYEEFYIPSTANSAFDGFGSPVSEVELGHDNHDNNHVGFGAVEQQQDGSSVSLDVVNVLTQDNESVEETMFMLEDPTESPLPQSDQPMDPNVDIDEPMFLIPVSSSIPLAQAAAATDQKPAVQDLRTTEKLDRSSPELWPQNLRTKAKQILREKQLRTGTGEPEPFERWAPGLDREDINFLHQFGSLTSLSLCEEVKKLGNIVGQLNLEEERELARGRLLHVLDDPKDVNH